MNSLIKPFRETKTVFTKAVIKVNGVEQIKTIDFMGLYLKIS